MTETAATTELCVLITTKHRGVFGGFVPAEQDLTARTIKVRGMRCAIRWDVQGGFLELAERGPGASARIGLPADCHALHDITGVWEITPKAWAAWEARTVAK